MECEVSVETTTTFKLPWKLIIQLNSALLIAVRTQQTHTR